MDWEYRVSPEGHSSLLPLPTGHSCLYVSFTRLPITELTIMFVESQYPKDLLAHLKKIRGYTGAYLDAIGRAKPEKIEEALRMSRSQGRGAGQRRGKIKKARKE
jgi:hypothetical protein